MVIRKINTVFSRHGRVIFGVITIIIIISFMGFMQPGSGFSEFFSNWGKRNAYGEIFGKTISHDDIIDKANRSLIINDIRHNTGLNSYQATSRAEANAFYNLCLLAVAKRRGIDVSNKEVADFIYAGTKFKNPETKIFDKKIFADYIDGELKSNGFTAENLDTAVREYLVQNKLSNELQNSIVVTKDEVREFYKLCNERYYASYAVFDKARFLKNIKVSEKEAENYFAAETPSVEDYIPGKSKALLVVFKYSDPEILERVAKQLTPEAVKDFYDNNKNLFMNFKPGQKPENIPFAKVQGKAKKMLAERYAKKFASEKAVKFAETAYDVVGETVAKKQRRAFEDVVAEFKYKAAPTDWFRDDAGKIGDIQEPLLVREISSLHEVPVSNAVTGRNAAYVAFITDRTPSRPALFEEVKDKIIAKLKELKALKLARSQAREVAAKLQKMNKAERLKSIAAFKDPKFENVKAFSLMSPPRTEYGNVVAGLSRELMNGGVAPIQNTSDGAILVVLKKRVLPAMSGFDKKQQEMLTNAYRNQKIVVAETAFLAWLQTKCHQNKTQ